MSKPGPLGPLTWSFGVDIDVKLIAMPTKSTYPDLDIPNVDIWTFLFERKDRPYPDDKGKQRKPSFESREHVC